MLPVSGALQLNASGAIHERPMISHSGAYSRLVSPAPRSDSGRNRFHSPAARAFAFSSSITFVGTHAIAALAVRLDLGGEHRLRRIDVLVHEARDARGQILHFRRIREIHDNHSPRSCRCAISHATSATSCARLPCSSAFAAGRVALQRAGEHAVQDRRDAKHVEDQVELPVRDAGAARARAVRGDVRGFGRNTERGEVAALEAAKHSRREAPRHRMVGEVRQRMTECGELPIEHGEHARLGRMEDHVVDAIVAMDDRGLVACRHMPRQPSDQRVHRGDPVGWSRLVLLRPAGDLALDVLSGLAEIGEADRRIVDSVQRRQHAIELVVVRPAARAASCRAVSDPRAPGLRHTPSDRRACR